MGGGWEIDVLKKEMWTRKSGNETNSGFQLKDRPVEEHGKKAEGDGLSSRSAHLEVECLDCTVPEAELTNFVV